MIRTISFSALTVAMAVGSFASAGPITYNVEPVVLSDGGYMIDGGFITTNGTLGPLSASDITNYRIQVSGPDPFVFTPNQGGSVSVHGRFDASASSLVLPIDTFDDGIFPNSISFLHQTFQGTDVVEELSVFWGTSITQFDDIFATLIAYKQGPGALGALNEFALGPLVVATVPEPSSIIMLLLGMCAAGLAARRIPFTARFKHGA